MVDANAPRVLVHDVPLSVDACVRAVQHTQAGAICVFIGVVRDHTRKDGARVDVTRLQYEAYVAMAQAVLVGIVDEAETRWPGVRACVHHRIGDLVPGDLAVVVAASDAHRAPSFEACRHVIERLKQDAPIWKREHDAQGISWVGMGP